MIFTGGMEALTLDQIKKKSELEEDIDFFENGDSKLNCDICDMQLCKILFFFLLYFLFSLTDLLRVPPGFKSGMDFTDKGYILY